MLGLVFDNRTRRNQSWYGWWRKYGGKWVGCFGVSADMQKAYRMKWNDRKGNYFEYLMETY